jgi:hypothetical protein
MRSTAMKKLLLTSIAALALFTATQPMSAIEWQGKLPTPVQKLPHYPPVVCVATDWATEPCEGRQTPLPQPNPFRAFATRKRIPAKTKMVLYDEYGGILQEHIQRFQALAASGDDVEIRGVCNSACTMIIAIVPADRLCFGERAALGFHSSRDAESNEPVAKTNRWMVMQYPQDIRDWIMAKGGVEKFTIYAMWKLTAEDLWDMGYRKCEPEEAPVPMTTSSRTNEQNWEAEVWLKLDAGETKVYRDMWMTHEDCSDLMSRVHLGMVNHQDLTIKLDGQTPITGLILGGWCHGPDGTWMGYRP